MVTKFEQYSAKVALNLVLCKKRGIIRMNSKVFGVGNFKYAI